jgi:hypothetical protein
MSTTTFPFLSINDLPEFIMIAGSNQKLFFSIFTSACVAVNLSGASGTWRMAYYGNSAATLSKNLIFSGSSNIVEVDLEPVDTSSLSGKFIHQPTIIDSSGSIHRPSQGIISIIPGLA